VFDAEIAKTVDSTSDDLFVKVPSFDGGEHRWGPVNWSPAVDDDGFPLYPQKGDSCLLLQSPNGTLWLLWTP
jgi:hypothetical protein